MAFVRIVVRVHDLAVFLEQINETGPLRDWAERSSS
jgi:hypothetical protein